ncbi:MAG: ABC transporter permease [Actinomycetota bacterium]
MTSIRRVLLVARREWNQRVRSTAFRVSTLVSAAIVVAIIAVPQMYGGGVTPTRTVGLVGESLPKLPGLLQAAGEQVDLTVTTRTFQDEADGDSALRSGDVDVLLVGGRALVWKAETDDRLGGVVSSAVQAATLQRAIAQGSFSPDQQQLLRPPALTSRSLEPVTKEREAQMVLATIGLVLLFLAISVYGGFLLTGVVEEKSTRVVEVLLSRLKPAELLWGKIAGIGLVGLAQFAIVAVTALITVQLSRDTQAPATTPATIGWTVFWFVLGYGFYSVLYAAAGSLVSRQEEAQSMTLPVAGILLVGYFFALSAVRSPDGTAALVGSFLPPTAPMVMIVRIAGGGVPWWQIALSATLTIAAIVGMVALAGRVYAGAVLRIGRRVKLAEAWRGAEL